MKPISVVALVLITPLNFLWISAAYGYSGPDHHWSTELLHWLFYISMCFMVVSVMFGIVRILTEENADKHYD